MTTALLSWFGLLGRRGPLLLVVDDVQWLDRASALALSRVARRLSGLPVALLTAQRSGSESFLDERTDTLTLGPLDDADAARLLRSRAVPLHPATRRRVILEAGGNPLALVELPRALTSEEERAGDRLPVVLRLTDRLRTMFAARVEALPRPTRHLLLLAALNGRDGAPLVPTLAAAAADLAPAEEQGLVRVERDQRLVFRHPLTRAATVELATPAERRAAHRHLAELATDPSLRAVHRGEAALGYDEDAAAALQEAGRVAVSRGDVVQAVARMVRAAELTAEPRERARRLAEAAYLGANFSGSLDGAHALLEEARRAAPDAVHTLGAAAAAAAHLLNSDGDIDTAHRMLVAALAHADPRSTDPAVEAAVTTLMAVCTFGGRAALWEELDRTVARFSTVLPRALVLGARTFGDPARSTPAMLAELDALVEQIGSDTNPVRILQVGLAGHYVDRLPRAAVERVVDDARRGGAVAAGANGLILLAVDAYHTGRWTEAVALAQECAEWCRENGYPTLEWGALHVSLLVAAARGDRQRLRDAHERAHRWAVPRRAYAVRTFTSGTEALAALASGRHEDAYALLTSVAPPGDFPDHDQLGVWSLLDLVEAAVGTGRVGEARAHVEAATALGLPRVSPRLAFQCRAGRAMTADARTYRAAFEDVVDDPGASAWPFHLARVELAFGDRLRQDRELRRARVRLERAVELFARLDATPWLDRARTSLRSTGRTVRRAAAAPDALTPQEREIARLAASGLTNRQIGSRLFLSPRTVGGHLYRVFPKLGISTRAALRDALTERERERATTSAAPRDDAAYGVS
ncbi:helix-turn-helix transcriptional regulator [Cellulosimicrobium composti]|uniref:helix-turn-helix transcriptional regulator n=1 Tax=Cellulosimicrobium composti TaxID=2672572 RepID=UPI0037A4AC32